MKGRFTTVDIIAACVELNAKHHGLRVYNIYDCDHKTYLIRLVGPDAKAMLLVESGIRIHSTAHDWPKSASPSGFTMKLRKHLRGRRFEHVQVLGGIDRIVDFQFGSGEAAYHLIVELYDVGNIVLTDHSYTILNILRRRTDKETATRFSNHAVYPVHLARQKSSICTESGEIVRALNSIADTKQPLKRALGIMELSPYGVALLQHCLLRVGMNPNDKLKQFVLSESPVTKPLDAASVTLDGETENNEAKLSVSRIYRDGFVEQLQKVFILVEECIQSLRRSVAKGFIITCDPPPVASKAGKKKGGTDAALDTELPVPADNVLVKQQFDEFHPMLYEQLLDKPHEELDSFLIAVDTYYSQIEEQRLTNKIAVHQRQAADKLLKVRRDHEARLRGLRNVQEVGVRRAELIALNRGLVDDVIEFLNNLIAVGMSWERIEEFIQVEQQEGDPVACRILRLELEHNSVVIVLNDPFVAETDITKGGENTDECDNSEASASDGAENSDDADDDEPPRSNRKLAKKPVSDAADDEWVDVTIDLQLNAFQNMEKLHTEKRTALKKEEKTLQSSEVALRNAERKANEAMKTVSKIQNIHKTRKTFWFEKFQWFLSSDGILVIAGRDRQQNELIVKRHLSERDLYVHAELHGASSVVIKSALKAPLDADSATDAVASSLPARTLREAGIFSACLSHAWSENVSTRSWWVYAYQVSKTAPTGEYLPTGSFMIRGRKNFLPVEPMVMGFGFLFKLDDVSAERRLKQQHQEQNESTGVVAEVTDDSKHGENYRNGAVSPQNDADDNDGLQEFPDIQLGAPGISNMPIVGDNTGESGDNVYDIVDKTYAGTSVTANVGKKPNVAATKQQQQKQRGAQKKSSVEDLVLKQTEQAQPKAAKSAVEKPVHAEEKRGAKNKKRVQRKKYADQDDEERLLRTKLYKTKEQARGLLSDTNGIVTDEQPLSDQFGRDNAEMNKNGNVSAQQVEADGDNNIEVDAVDGPERDGDGGDDDEAVKTVAATAGADAGDAVVEDNFDDNLVELNEENFVTGVCADPTPEDSLLWCIPVCTPYTTMVHAKYKYKVKLIPAAAQANSANMKRSKIVKSAVAVMSQQKDATELEKELIKSVKEQELYKTIIGNAKIGLAAQVLKKATTKGKPKKKKAGIAASAADE